MCFLLFSCLVCSVLQYYPLDYIHKNSSAQRHAQSRCLCFFLTGTPACTGNYSKTTISVKRKGSTQPVWTKEVLKSVILGDYVQLLVCQGWCCSTISAVSCPFTRSPHCCVLSPLYLWYSDKCRSSRGSSVQMIQPL